MFSDVLQLFMLISRDLRETSLGSGGFPSDGDTSNTGPAVAGRSTGYSVLWLLTVGKSNTEGHPVGVCGTRTKTRLFQQPRN